MRSEWVFIDVETDGLKDPIHVIQVAAQRMIGWEAHGEAFHAYLNHGVKISSKISSIHGLTSEFLAQWGETPNHVHERLSDYIGRRHVVSHNLAFDWNRCLMPEWERVGAKSKAQRGFCTLMLSRRLLRQVPSFKLAELSQRFHLRRRRAHSALHDVWTASELISRVFAFRLKRLGFRGIEDVMAFCKEPPLKCIERVDKETRIANDLWYCKDGGGAEKGPFRASEIHRRLIDDPCWNMFTLNGVRVCEVRRNGGLAWANCWEAEEFAEAVVFPGSQADAPDQGNRAAAPSGGRAKSIDELIGLCRGIMADGRITNKEVFALGKWLEDAGHLTEWPACEIADCVEKILEDGVVTKEERAELKGLLQRVLQ